MARYTVSVNGVALSTTNDLKTLQTTATGAGSVIKVPEIYLSGEAGSSAFARVVVNRPSASPTGAATSQTPEKIDPASVAAAFTAATTYATTQSTLSTNDVLILGFNAFGGVVRWLAMPDYEIVTGSQGAIAYLSIRSRSGTSTVSGHVVVEER